jgi:thymidylate synthase
MTIQNSADAQYRQLLETILTQGRFKGDRTGTGTYSIFGRQMRFNLQEGFPLITGKFTAFKPIKAENIWFASGSSNNRELNALGATIWDEWDVVPLSATHLSVLITSEGLSDAFRTPEVIAIENSANELKWKPMLTADNPYVTIEDSVSFLEMDFIMMFKYENGLIPESETSSWSEWYKVYVEAQFKFYRAQIEFCKQHKLSYTHGGLGPVYGVMWREWPTADGKGIDQLLNAVETLKNNPTSRRIIINSWNPELLPEEGRAHEINVIHGKQVLPPCHVLFQFYAEELTVEERTSHVTFARLEDGSIPTPAITLADLIDKNFLKSMEELSEIITEWHDRNNTPKHRLSCQVYIRSNDVFLGTPFNIAGYALITLMMAQVVNMAPGDLVYTIGDAHIYSNHMEQVKQYLAQKTFPLPTVKLNPAVTTITGFTMSDIELIGYKHGGKIPAPVAI